MKKYLSGMIAIIFAFTCVAFTNGPKVSNMLTGTTLAAPTADPCSEANKKWFIINRPCNNQVWLEDITTPADYTVTTYSTALASCAGTECVCAIFACQAANGKPVINTGTTIYAALYDYYQTTTLSNYIMLKDQYWGR